MHGLCLLLSAILTVMDVMGTGTTLTWYGLSVGQSLIGNIGSSLAPLVSFDAGSLRVNYSHVSGSSVTVSS